MPSTFELMQLDPDGISAGDLADVEERTGITLSALVDEMQRLAATPAGQFPDIRGNMLLAIVFLSGRQADPAFTWEQARAVKVTSLRPTSGAGAPLQPLRNGTARPRTRKTG